MTDTRKPGPLAVDPASQPNPVLPEADRPQRRVQLVMLLITLAAVGAGVVMLAKGSSASGSGWGSTSALLAAVSLLATLSYLGVFVVLHLLPTGYSPVRHAVSDYAVGKYGPLFRAGLYASSLGVLALAFALIVGVGSPTLATRDLIYLLLIPVTRVGMTLFPTNLEGQRTTATGLIHYVFAIAAFTFTYLAISETTAALRGLDPALWLQTPLRWIAWLVGPALVLVIITMLRPLRRIFGLFERLFLLSTNIWFLLAAVLVLYRAV